MGNLPLAAKILENIMEGVVITDAHKNIEYVNPAFCTITGYSAGEVIGKNPKILKSGHHDEAFYKTMWASLARTGQWQGEIWNRRKNGEVYPEWENIVIIRDDAGSIINYVAIFSDISTLKHKEQRFYHLAHHDALTGLPNRLLFDDRLQQMLAQASRQSQMLAVLFIDLDDFKTINDTQGHAVGDQLLRIAAERLMGCVRSADTVARLGGDEFTALLTNIARRRDAELVAQKILEMLARAFVIGKQELFTTASIGIALYPADGVDAETLFHNADSAMYCAKQAGKNKYRLYSPTLAPAE
ncbi:MAG: diguanylate cyclase [Gammaproteobacteria bacterium]|nr:diguanylate cyclase [Gammaproteobacteria bacterium]